MNHDGAGSGLPLLETRLRWELEALDLPAKAWVPPTAAHDGQPVHDVIVVGAGMLGMCATAALRLKGISSVICLDRAAEGQEGPWVTFARMETLRTPKTAIGPALGIPALTFRAWYEACHGAPAWNRLERIPCRAWMDYLRWYRRVLDLPVRNNAQVTAIEPLDNAMVRVRVKNDEAPLIARRVVLAMGIDALGKPFIPPIMAGIDPALYAHSADIFDPTALRGLRVGVVGGGSSAMDNAAAALESGAASVDMFVRRPQLPSIDRFGGINSAGLAMGYVNLPDDAKWELMRVGLAQPVPPPRHSTLRVSRHGNATLRLSCPVGHVRQVGRTLLLTTPQGEITVDFLIFATGFACDPASRPELASIAGLIRYWGDRYAPEPGHESPALEAAPDLAPDFSFYARNPADQTRLSHIYDFSFDAVMSHGKLTSGVPAMNEAALRLVRGIATSLLVEDREKHIGAFHDYDTPELRGDEWPEAQIRR
ncbi:FAD-dependent oxidoreductase [Komagataeibacter nataicola]|uniref:FAD-dependent oxidoreductase n=1 Tax=Komagataeibacter nataicola TaxID=265960 RepID=A0A9N7CAE7_9PROT|nr:NAD(P)/FAD-dependent oxidoreductase [Komagataeibacter nataicola]AQU88406.1 FAD-dependent oxidoreductase [Komagataeibacter nataicola]PYD65211.1 FAD-dependent oxidoreductase [Komagataeibacter nataicola]WEQ54497.1 NAD(P)/FAD-dependent oxidoreductase [Komagataeibacter nataicola]WNM08875.1 NAD(P)/FAD-dependent oxidoreductase [Komagataeibacter nataicola]GBR21459.1 putative flavoprotein [Komagataeibacter nataicola NRIC 0616]